MPYHPIPGPTRFDLTLTLRSHSQQLFVILRVCMDIAETVVCQPKIHAKDERALRAESELPVVLNVDKYEGE